MSTPSTALKALQAIPPSAEWPHLPMKVRAAIEASIAAISAPAQDVPIDMVLHCPACGMQHIDATEYERDLGIANTRQTADCWTNPPHRSHQCHYCKGPDGKPFIWRPADVPTNGVSAVKTKGKADSPLIGRAAPARAAQDAQAEPRFVDELVEWNKATGAVPEHGSWYAELYSMFDAADHAVRTARIQPAIAAQDAPVKRKPVGAGIAAHALAAEIIEALLADEKDGGYDLTAGLFGKNFSRMVRRWAVLELEDAARTQPATPAAQDATATFTSLVSACQLAALTVYQHAPSDICVLFERALSDAERALLADHFVDVNKMVPAQDAAATVPDLRERLAEAHDASLDTDHHTCRAILMEIIRLLDATPAPPSDPVESEDRRRAWMAAAEGLATTPAAQDAAATVPAWRTVLEDIIKLQLEADFNRDLLSISSRLYQISIRAHIALDATPPAAPQAHDERTELAMQRLGDLLVKALGAKHEALDDWAHVMFALRAAAPQAAQLAGMVPLTDADRQDAEAYRRINTPEIADFLVGVHNESLHQRERWGAEGDAGKTDADWYWLVGYLAGKAIRPDATPEKQLHHIITTAAALLNWHAARLGAYAAMRPGIDPAAHGITPAATKEQS